MPSKLKPVGEWLTTRLTEASTYSGLAFLLYMGDHKAYVLSLICCGAAIILPELRK